LIAKHFGHSGQYLKDGIYAMNTALMQGGVFVYVPEATELAHPVYVYHFQDARSQPGLALPRSLVYVGRNAQLQWVENFQTLGNGESLTNQVTEVVLEADARFYHYKLQQDHADASLVSTTHIRQLGKSFAYAVTISLDGHIVRNNTHMVMEAEYGESHLYGLYLLQGKTLVDNHTVVDNVMPNCYSNELYKGVIAGEATGVFNGKIFVRPDAQKTNAYQSNKNLLLGEAASMNTKPQLEIFADDVKCSHGCTIGRLDEEALFYLKSRGVPEKQAQSLLLHSFTSDILEKILLEPIREFAEESIHRRLEML
jgi:Fe-S cluster assembly protein SufD